MNVDAGNQPSVPAAFAPAALHAEPFQRATWSACGIPATFTESVPMNTSVPFDAMLRT